MKLYQITLPNKDNVGRPYALAHRDWSVAAVKLAGGLTILPETAGVWIDEAGKRFQDICTPYQVACSPGQWGELVALAFEKFPDQFAIMHAELGIAKIENRPVSAAVA